jgi:hypothetical protein
MIFKKALIQNPLSLDRQRPMGISSPAGQNSPARPRKTAADQDAETCRWQMEIATEIQWSRLSVSLRYDKIVFPILKPIKINSGGEAAFYK